MSSPQALAAARQLFSVRLIDDHADPEIVASFIDAHIATPNAALPPLDPAAPRRKMVVTIEVAADFEKRLDNQWMVEREIAADRWSWEWAPPAASDTP